MKPEKKETTPISYPNFDDSATSNGNFPNQSIPKSTIEAIKQLNLADFLKSQGLQLKKEGKDWKCLCPLHQEKTASFTISIKDNRYLWRCFGCNQGGTIIDYVIKSKNTDFKGAIEYILQHPNLQPIPTSQPKQENLNSIDPETRQKLLKKIIKYYHETLRQNVRAKDYLKKRNIYNKTAINEFQIGFADRSFLKDYLPDKNTKEGKEIRKQLTEIGILRPSGHEHFAGSLIFPIIDENGNITEIYGRKISSGLRAGTIYHSYLKGPHEGIFNYKCLESDTITLCESIIDALSFWIHGHKNVTASYGTNGFTKEMARIFITHKIKKIYIAYDHDETGNRATKKLADQLMSSGIECHRVLFPMKMDANDFICEKDFTPDKLEKLLKEAINLTTDNPIFSLAASPTAANSEANTKETAKRKTDELLKKYDVPAQIEGEEVYITIANRIYRIRGLQKNNSFDVMRINIRVSLDDRFHMDTLDIFQAKQRGTFVHNASTELRFNKEVLKVDIGKVLFKLEQLQRLQIDNLLNPKKKEVTLTEKEKREGLAFLRDPKLIETIIKHFAICGLVGEDLNALVCYIAAISRKLDDPLALIIQSASSSGKSTLMDIILSMMPEEDYIKYSAMTSQALYYLGRTNLAHKTLAIAEEQGAEKASYPLKLLQSEKELRIASTGKNPKTGFLETNEYKVEGPIQPMMTTTSEEIDEELQNRFLVATTNEQRGQTRAIHSLQREKETLEGLIQKKQREEIIKLHQNAQRLLKPVMVVNPYAKELTFLDSKLRTRRDHIKYLTLIRAIALLHQYQRPTKKLKHQDQVIEYIEVHLDDLKTANYLADHILGTSLDELAPQTRKLLDLIYSLVTSESQRLEIDPQDYRFTRRDIRNYSGFSNTQTKVHLDRLVEMEYILPHRGKKGIRYIYELLYRGEGKSKNSFLMGLLDPDKLKNKNTNTHSGCNLSG